MVFCYIIFGGPLQYYFFSQSFFWILKENIACDSKFAIVTQLTLTVVVVVVKSKGHYKNEHFSMFPTFTDVIITCYLNLLQFLQGTWAAIFLLEINQIFALK